jgi:hypothetical protein
VVRGECDFSPGRSIDGSAPSPRRDEVSKLAAFDFDGIGTTDEVQLSSLPKEYLIDLEDVCVVERGRREGQY